MTPSRWPGKEQRRFVFLSSTHSLLHVYLTRFRRLSRRESYRGPVSVRSFAPAQGVEGLSKRDDQ